jgi:5'-nucleotidase
MKRRNFVQHSLVLGAGLSLSPQLLARPKRPKSLRKVTILHTNDTHSNIDVFPDSHAKFPNKGGVARRMALLEQIRREEEHVLLLDAGDIFQGTPYFNRYQGTLEMKLMTMMNYDCATMGNHDFDIGMDGFLNAKHFADFPFICSNYDFSDTILDQQTEAYRVFEKGDIRIGVFGLGVELEGLVMKSNYGDTRYLDPVEQANKWAVFLRHEANCDLVICLSHLGYQYRNRKISDKSLANLTREIDLIIGGHTHTFLEKPSYSKNADGKMVLINQVGWAGLALGRIDFFLDDRKRNKPYEMIMV